MQGLRIRTLTPEDLPVLLSLVRELAEYERLSHEVFATEEGFRTGLFGSRPTAEAMLAELDGQACGYMLWFTTFSTFLARPGLWLEDLFVRPSERSRGIGRALLSQLAAIAAERGCGRMEWAVLDWNDPAKAFYRRLGAAPNQDWTVWRLTGASLAQLGSGA